MEGIFVGWLLLALTTALTALIRIYSPTMKVIRKLYPNTPFLQGNSKKYVGALATFLFVFALFPIMIFVLFIEEHRMDFIENLAEVVSQG